MYELCRARKNFMHNFPLSFPRLSVLSFVHVTELGQGRESSSFVTSCCYTFIICLKNNRKVFSTNMADFASIGSWFEGCIALLRYSSASKPFENVKLLKSQDVDGNCSGEACSSELNVCQHGGQCVDLVTRTECDCEGTGYYGQYCEQSGIYSIFVFTPSHQ